LKRPGKLVLENGETFSGQLWSASDVDCSGEVVFTTGMSGYVESLTDPSFAGQILAFTYPLIGNYGVPDLSYWESSKIQVRAAVISSDRQYFSHFQAKKGLFDWFEEQGIPLLIGVDTRRLVRVLRQQAGMKGQIQVVDEIAVDPMEYVLCPKNSAFRPVIVSSGSLSSAVARGVSSPHRSDDPTVILLDGGFKQNILRELTRFPLNLRVLPWDHDLTQESYDGLVISNGPGDPSDYLEAIRQVKMVLERKRPIFGICLGAQILALAIGARVRRLPLGHRGQNHPCLELSTGKAYLTAQNHGYAIDEETLPPGWKVSFRHLQDQSVSGIEHETESYFAVQFHPEGAPGPHDTKTLFKKFYDSLR
jgi:carbamoyl-phosphate synthase small subunit